MNQAFTLIGLAVLVVVAAWFIKEACVPSDPDAPFYARACYVAIALVSYGIGYLFLLKAPS